MNSTRPRSASSESAAEDLYALYIGKWRRINGAVAEPHDVGDALNVIPDTGEEVRLFERGLYVALGYRRSQ